MSPVIEVSHLHHTYPDGTSAIRDVSFSIAAGESVGIIGANGAGKSTMLLHLVACLQPTSGTLSIGGLLSHPGNVTAIRQRAGLVFQNPDDQLFMPTVQSDVAFGPRNQGLDEDSVTQRVTEALTAVGELHLLHRPPYRLSGGEKRAVSIATVLSMRPDILVLDEPSAGLDPSARRKLISLLSSLDHTRIVASHDLDLVLDVCQRVILMRSGQVAADGPARDILRDKPLLEQCGLELPLAAQACPNCGCSSDSPRSG